MRNNFDAEIYEKINLIQLSQEEKMKRADFSVNTDTNLLKLETEINRVLKMLMEQEKWN